jgi:molybdopterin converting factor small subunit
MPTVIIPPPYQGPTRGTGRLEVEGDTVQACLDAVERRFPGFRAQVVAEGGQVHRFVKLFVNRRLLDGDALDRELRGSDELEIVAAIAGGR